MTDKEWFDVLERQIERPGGIMQFFVNKCICGKVYHSLISYYAGKFRNPRLLEAGCGTAVDSIRMSYIFDNVEAIDKDKKVIGLARKNNSYLNGRVNIVQKDMFHLEKEYDVIFSGGTYEHFSKNNIKKLLSHHLKHSTYLVFMVPNDMSRDFESYGNENLMPLREWKGIIKDVGGKLLGVYGFDFRYKLLVPATYVTFLSRFFNRFGSHKIFVVKSERKGK